MKSVFVVVISMFLFAGSSRAENRPWIDLSDSSRTMHPQPKLGKVYLEPAFEDYTFMLFDTCQKLKLDCVVFPMMGDLENAVAYQTKEDTRVIVYDRRLSSIVGGDGAHAIIAHELGHHYCGHLTTRSKLSAHDAEVEADRFMAFAMQKEGMKLSELISVFENLGVNKTSESHPSLSKRVAAIASGFSASDLTSICEGSHPN